MRWTPELEIDLASRIRLLSNVCEGGEAVFKTISGHHDFIYHLRHLDPSDVADAIRLWPKRHSRFPTVAGLLREVSLLTQEHKFGRDALDLLFKNTPAEQLKEALWDLACQHGIAYGLPNKTDIPNKEDIS